MEGGADIKRHTIRKVDAHACQLSLGGIPGVELSGPVEGEPVDDPVVARKGITGPSQCQLKRGS